MAVNDSEGGCSIPESNNLDAAIVTAVADETGVSMEDLDETLNEVIDPDALTNLFREDSWGQVQFEFNGCRVTVDSERTVEVTS